MAGNKGEWARGTGDVGQGSVGLSGAVFSSLTVSSLLRQEQTATAFSQQVLLLAWDVCMLWFCSNQGSRWLPLLLVWCGGEQNRQNTEKRDIRDCKLSFVRSSAPPCPHLCRVSAVAPEAGEVTQYLSAAGSRTPWLWPQKPCPDWCSQWLIRTQRPLV